MKSRTMRPCRWIFTLLSTALFAFHGADAQSSPPPNASPECANKDIELERDGFGTLQADSLETDGDRSILTGVCFRIEGFDFVAQQLEVSGTDLSASGLQLVGEGARGTASQVRSVNGIYALEDLRLSLTLPNARLGNLPLEGEYTLTSNAAQLAGGRLSVKQALLERLSAKTPEHYALEKAEIGQGTLRVDKIALSRDKLNLTGGALTGQLEPLTGRARNLSASYCRVPGAGELDFSLTHLDLDSEKVWLGRLEGRFFGLPFLSVSALEFGTPGILNETLGGKQAERTPSNVEGTVPPLELLNGSEGVYGVRHLPVSSPYRVSSTLESPENGAIWNAALERGTNAALARLNLGFEPRANNLGLTFERDISQGFQARAAVNSSIYKFSGFEAGYGWTVHKLKTDLLAGLALENSQNAPYLQARVRLPLEWVSGRLSTSGTLEAHGYAFEGSAYGALDLNFRVRSSQQWGALELTERLKLGWGDSPVTAFRVENSSKTALSLSLNEGKWGLLQLEESRLSFALQADAQGLSSSRLGGSVRLLPTGSRVGVTPSLGYDFARSGWDGALELNVFSECFMFSPKVGLEWREGVPALKLGFSVRLR